VGKMAENVRDCLDSEKERRAGKGETKKTQGQWDRLYQKARDEKGQRWKKGKAGGKVESRWWGNLGGGKRGKKPGAVCLGP